MTAEVWSRLVVEPDWYRTSRVGVEHEISVHRHHGDGHGARYVAGCSGCWFGTVSMIDREQCVDAGKRHLSEIAALDGARVYQSVARRPTNRKSR